MMEPIGGSTGPYPPSKNRIVFSMFCALAAEGVMDPDSADNQCSGEIY
ncbi:hypothetical protein [Lelliottia wanjuensis]|nr:hypothetical protein [Lelliottia sp. V104_15]MDK9606072.1 hypothetical protein [Lelliottia sp. V104_15]